MADDDKTRRREPLREAEKLLLDEARARYEATVGPAWARLQHALGAVMGDHGAPPGSRIAEDEQGRVLAVEWPAEPPPAATPPAPPGKAP